MDSRNLTETEKKKKKKKQTTKNTVSICGVLFSDIPEHLEIVFAKGSDGWWKRVQTCPTPACGFIYLFRKQQ